MKKVISVLLSMVIAVTTLFGATSVYANGTATDKLEQIETISGYIPGRTAVSSNCYTFVSKVCQYLYGVPYAEGLLITIM